MRGVLGAGFDETEYAKMACGTQLWAGNSHERSCPALKK